jgi:hypothetical protein
MIKQPERRGARIELMAELMAVWQIGRVHAIVIVEGVWTCP